MVGRRGCILQASDRVVAKEATERTGICTTGNLEVNGSLSGDRYTAGRREGSAIIGTNCLTHFVWILAQRYRGELIQIELPGKVCAFGTHICNRAHHVSGELVLNIEMPLLHIGPTVLVRQGYDADGKKCARRCPDVVVADDVELHRHLDCGRRVF